MQGRRDLGCNLAEHCSFTRADIDCGSPKLKNHAAECLKQCQKWSIKMLWLFIALGKLCLKTEMLIEKRLSSSANKRLKSALNLVVWDLNTISCPIRSFQVFPNIHLYLNPRREFFFFWCSLICYTLNTCIEDESVTVGILKFCIVDEMQEKKCTVSNSFV